MKILDEFLGGKWKSLTDSLEENENPRRIPWRKKKILDESLKGP